MIKWVSLVIFILGVVMIGGWIGYTNAPAEWYLTLNKPFFTPPNAAFAPIWTVLYVIIGFVGWRVFIDKPNPQIRILWCTQMVLNFIWSPVFFGAQMVGPALIICLGILVCAVWFIWKSWNVDRLSAYLFCPYVVWLILACSLNGGVFLLNA